MTSQKSNISEFEMGCYSLGLFFSVFFTPQMPRSGTEAEHCGVGKGTGKADDPQLQLGDVILMYEDKFLRIKGCDEKK